MATGNTPKKTWKFGCVVFEFCVRRSRQTDAQTDRLATILRNPKGAK